MDGAVLGRDGWPLSSGSAGAEGGVDGDVVGGAGVLLRGTAAGRPGAREADLLTTELELAHVRSFMSRCATGWTASQWAMGVNSGFFKSRPLLRYGYFVLT